jgi:serine/threonine-protein kinase
VAGVKAAKGSQITIKIGKAPEKVQLPDVTGQTADDAQATLKSSGFKVQTKDVDSTEKQGVVVAQNPPAGQAAKGTVVTLSVSKGNQIVMPDLSGLSLNEAKTKLSQLGFTGDLNSEKVAVTDPTKNNEIQQQDTQPGKTIAKNGSVNVQVGEFKIGASTTSSR